MPPVACPGRSSTPNQMTKKTIVTATAGSISSVPIASPPTRAPLAPAPMMTAISSAKTRTPAASRVNRSWRGSPAVRRWMMATSIGSQTT